MPAIGYGDPNQSHFTSRHYWEVGEVNPFGRIGWLGRYLDRHGSADNPLQGLSLDWNLAPALAAAKCRWRPSPTRSTSRSTPATCGTAAIRTKLIDALRAQGTLADRRRRARERPQRRAPDGRAARPARRACRAPTRRGRPRSPTRARTASAPPGGAGRDARHGPADEGRRARRQRRLRHARQPERLAARRPRDVRPVAGARSRPTSRRAGWRTAC